MGCHARPLVTTLVSAPFLCRLKSSAVWGSKVCARFSELSLYGYLIYACSCKNGGFYRGNFLIVRRNLWLEGVIRKFSFIVDVWRNWIFSILGFETPGWLSVECPISMFFFRRIF